MNLADYLSGELARRWRWGEADCLMMLAGWVRQRVGADPAICIRGTYGTEAEALELIRKHRGLVGCIEHCLRPIGIARTDAPMAGDIGVVFAQISRRGVIKKRLVGAICLKPGMWIVKTADGLAAKDFKVWRAWRTAEVEGS